MPPVSEGWDHPVHKCDPGQAPKEDDAGGESNESSRADVQRPVTEEVEGYGCATGRRFYVRYCDDTSERGCGSPILRPNVHIDEDCGVDQRVEDIVNALVLVKLALTVVPRENVARDECSQEIVRAHLYFRMSICVTQKTAAPTRPMKPKQKKARPIPYERKFSSITE
jgi:hypothetical protein